MQAQGSMAQLIMQLESAYKTTQSTAGRVKSKKVYFSSESLAFSQEFASSNVLRGATRHPTAPLRGSTDVGGSISTEMMAATPLLYAGLGSMESVMTGGTMGTALTTPTAVIDAINQIMTVTVTSHGLLTGDSVEILALTAPTGLNGKIYPVIDVPTVNTFVVRIPMGTTTTFTLGSGTIKKVTAVGTTVAHTLKAGGNLPSYSIEKGFLDIATPQYFLYKGCKVSKLGFSIGSSGLIELSSDWMGASETVGTSSFETGTTLDSGKASFDNLGIAAADVKLGGSAIASILSIDSISLENTLDGDTFVVGGGGARGAINAGVYKVTGNIKAMFEDVATYYTLAKNLTETSLDIKATRGTGAGTAGNESIQIVMPEIVLKPKAPAISGSKGIVQEYSFESFYDNHADATGMKIIISNATLPSGML